MQSMNIKAVTVRLEFAIRVLLHTLLVYVVLPIVTVPALPFIGCISVMSPEFRREFIDAAKSLRPATYIRSVTDAYGWVRAQGLAAK